MSNSYYGQGEQDQWSHYQSNSKYRTDTQQRQQQERARQRAAYEARAAPQSQATDANIDMASRNFNYMNLDGYGRPGPSNTINRTEDGRFVKENVSSRDQHRRGASDNTTDTREDTRPTSSASTKSSIFGGFSFSRNGTGASSSSHKHSSSAGDERQRRPSIKEKVQDVYRRMSNSYNKATDNFSKAVDPYVNITKLNAHERQRWEAELRQGAEDKEEEKRRSQSSYHQSYQQAYPSSPTTSHVPSRYSGESRTETFDFIERSETNQSTAPKPKKSKDLLTTGERAAVFVSKIVDPVKKRRDSDDSDMSFADIAPPAELDTCSRCGEAVTGFLTKGRCAECHKNWLQEFWDASDSPAISAQALDPEGTNSDYSNRSSSSSSPGIPRDVNEEEYMKLTASHRIRRVRQTMYSDPGNPFSLDDYSPTDAVAKELGNAVYDPDAIPTILKRLSDAVAEPEAESPISLGPNPFEEQAANHKTILEPEFIMLTPSSADITTIKLESTVYNPASPTTALAAPEQEPDSPISLGPNPFEERPSLNASPVLTRDSAQLLAPTPKRSGTPTLIRDHSIPSPTPPPKDENSRMILSGSVRRTVHPLRHRRSETVPSGSERKIGAGIGAGAGIRDTKFYGFYDDVLDGYRGSRMF